MTLTTDNEKSTKLMSEYLLQKILPALEQELIFQQFIVDALPPKPLSWSQKIRRDFVAYTNNLVNALLGREPVCDLCDLDEDEW